METLFVPEWAPNTHPLLVHFPIAILVLAAFGSLISFFTPAKWWDETKNTILYAAGSLSAIIVYYTGQAAADTVFLEAEAQSVLSEHADWAFWLVWFFALYALLRIALHQLDLFAKLSFRVIAFLTVLPGMFFLFETAEYGGKMVFGYGVGTGQLVELEKTNIKEFESESEPDLTSEYTSFKETDDGDWSWEITNSAVGDLISKFHWIEGTVNRLEPRVVTGTETSLQLDVPDSPNFFVTHNTYRDVQVDYYLNISGFSGQVVLAHHVIDEKNYDFVSLNSDGIIRQGRMTEGEPVIFEENTFKATDNLFVRVVSDGTHFRGYIDREMKVHGHGDAPGEGAVGIRLNGSGNILISNIELNQIN